MISLVTCLYSVSFRPGSRIHLADRGYFTPFFAPRGWWRVLLRLGLDSAPSRTQVKGVYMRGLKRGCVVDATDVAKVLV